MLFMWSFNSQVYALMRIMVGFLFLWHGVQKLFGFPDPMPAGVPAFIIYIAGPIELVGGALVMAGFFTRPAAFLSSGLMAAAYWLGHGTKALLPIQNGGDLAILYCFVFLFISTQGGGLWSVDAVQGRR
jgi:putative oxidoreductase